MIRVEILRPNRAALKPFVMLPFSLYKDDPFWVAPLIAYQMSLLTAPQDESTEKRFFLVYDGEKPVARVMAGIDRRFNEQHGVQYGYFSMFESARNIDYAAAALDAACAYLKQCGMEKVLGPSSYAFSDLSTGLLVDGFDGSPVLLNSYNPPYYADFFEKCGFEKHRDYFAYFMRMDEFDLDRMAELVPRVKKRFGFRVEHIHLNRANIDQTMRDILRVIQEAFPADWETSMPTMEDLQREIKVFKRFYRSEMTVLAYAGDRPIGFVLAVPDYNQAFKHMHGHWLPIGWLKYLYYSHRIDGARCNMQFVVPEYQNKAVNAAMLYEAYQATEKLGIKWLEGSNVDETNAISITNTEKVAKHKYRVYRKFEKSL